MEIWYISKVSEKDLEKVQDPYKSCKLIAVGCGKNKEIYCTERPAKLIGEGKPYWYLISDCPKRFPPAAFAGIAGARGRLCIKSGKR